jgi:hypothetical protein
MFALVPKNTNNPYFDQARDGCKKAKRNQRARSNGLYIAFGHEILNNRLHRHAQHEIGVNLAKIGMQIKPKGGTVCIRSGGAAAANHNGRMQGI